VELELVECQPLLEWLANNYKSFGATLEIITDKSQEGSQFVRGFGGIGGESQAIVRCLLKRFDGWLGKTALKYTDFFPTLVGRLKIIDRHSKHFFPSFQVLTFGIFWGTF
jgi:hypothetical protein